MFARYDGRRTPIQNGANNAATPATNAAMSDVPINGFIIVWLISNIPDETSDRSIDTKNF